MSEQNVSVLDAVIWGKMLQYWKQSPRPMTPSETIEEIVYAMDNSFTKGGQAIIKDSGYLNEQTYYEVIVDTVGEVVYTFKEEVKARYPEVDTGTKTTEQDRKAYIDTIRGYMSIHRYVDVAKKYSHSTPTMTVDDAISQLAYLVRLGGHIPADYGTLQSNLFETGTGAFTYQAVKLLDKAGWNKSTTDAWGDQIAGMEDYTPQETYNALWESSTSMVARAYSELVDEENQDAYTLSDGKEWSEEKAEAVKRVQTTLRSRLDN